VKNSQQKPVYPLTQTDKNSAVQSSARATNLRHGNDGNGSNLLLQVMRVYRVGLALIAWVLAASKSRNLWEWKSIKLAASATTRFSFRAPTLFQFGFSTTRKVW